MRYSRHLALSGFSEQAQSALVEARVLLVGLGGLGCPVASYLAAAGVASGDGELVLNDFDSVDETNLARQPLYAPADIGRAKVAVAASRLTELNPDLNVSTLDARLDREQMLASVAQSQLVIDATDNLPARELIADCARHTGTPLVFGAAIRWEGHYAVRRFDLGAAPLLHAGDEQLGDCAGSGVFGPLVGVIGSAMAGEALKLLIGEGDPGECLHLFDARHGSWRQLRI